MNVPSGSARMIEVAGRLAQAAPQRVAVALRGLADDARPRLPRLLGGAVARVVVDDDHFVDDAGGEEVLDRRADVLLLVVRRQHDGDGLRSVHRSALVVATTSICPARGFTGEAR